MTETAPAPIADPLALGHILADIAPRAQPLLQAIWAAWRPAAPDDPLGLLPAAAELMTRLAANPARLADLQTRWWQDWSDLMQSAVAMPSPDPFDFLRRSHGLAGRYLRDLPDVADGLDPAAKARLDFVTRQFVDATAPRNNLFTNQDLIDATLASRGENLLHGLQNLLIDLERGDGSLRVSTTDRNAFAPGRNLAVTPGRVVFENDLMQLIQYAPATAKTFAVPLLIVPPWINKYYILDLRPENSLVRWLVAQGHTVFMISWINPGPDHARTTFDDYLTSGVLAALAEVRHRTGGVPCNVAGYCLGGTLLAAALAWLDAHGRADEVASATFLTTLIDFAEAGDLKLFTDAATLDRLDAVMETRGVLPAAWLRDTFAWLRPHDMIWSFVIDNYVLGKTPRPFDLLYWNDDATNMPPAMHSVYLRQCYLENRLSAPGGMTMAGTPLDIGAVRTPAYFLSAQDDHIAPWRSTYTGARLFAGETMFTLAESGHVRGVVNPPGPTKYNFRSGACRDDPDAWLAAAAAQTGSWWPHWETWLRTHAGRRAAPLAISRSIEPAPGRYVMVRSDT